MMIYSLLAVYPGGTTIEHEVVDWTVLTSHPSGRMEEIWLCEDEASNVAGCSLSADRILVWERL